MQQKFYRPEIDGLRAVAVLMAILFHAGVPFLAGGFSGVDVFFVISGYLITSILLRDMAHGQFSFAGFYERRVRRILPALYVVMAVSLPAAWLYLMPSDLIDFFKSLHNIVTFSVNIHLYQNINYFDRAAELKPFLHTWSLSVEEQFYVLFPLILALSVRFFKESVPYVLMVLMAASFIAMLYVTSQTPPAAFYLLPTRGWQLLVGCIAACYLSCKPIVIPPQSRWFVVANLTSFIGLAAILAGAVFVSSQGYPNWFSLVPTVGALLIILAAAEGTITYRILSHRWMVLLGLLSYSAYLWHHVLFSFLRYVLLQTPSAWLLSALVPVIFMVSYVSWRWVEQPARRKPFPRKWVFTFAAVGSLLVFTIGFVGAKSNGFTKRFDGPFYQQIMHIKAVGDAQGINWGILSAGQEIEPKQLGATGKAPEFALIGDSHAVALASGMVQIGRDAGIGVLSLAHNNCAPLQKTKYFSAPALQAPCERLKQKYWANLEASAFPPNVIMLARWPMMIEQRRFDNEHGGVELGAHMARPLPADQVLARKRSVSADIDASVKALLESGRRVFLVYPVPEMGWNVPDRLVKIYNRRGRLAPDDAAIPYEVFKRRNAETVAILDAVGTHKNLIRIYPDKLFCDTLVAGKCAALDGDKVLYYDDDHVSTYGAALIFDDIFKKWRALP